MLSNTLRLHLLQIENQEELYLTKGAWKEFKKVWDGKKLKDYKIRYTRENATIIFKDCVAYQISSRQVLEVPHEITINCAIEDIQRSYETIKCQN